MSSMGVDVLMYVAKLPFVFPLSLHARISLLSIAQTKRKVRFSLSVPLSLVLWCGMMSIHQLLFNPSLNWLLECTIDCFSEVN
jgi:hypothetical protein